MTNYIDSPKENGYQSIHVKLLPDFGRWQEVHISSERMTRQSRLGCVAERTEDNIKNWIKKFRMVLNDTIGSSGHNDKYMEDIRYTFIIIDAIMILLAIQTINSIADSLINH